MTTIRFFTDPHIGKDLKANTTLASRAKLRDQLFEHAMQATTLGGDLFTVCCGDLFDQAQNPEQTLLQGAAVLGRCNLLIGGNHDVVNIAGHDSSLLALTTLMGRTGDVVMPPAPGRNHWQRQVVGDVGLFTVPHHATQESFEQTLDKIIAFRNRQEDSTLRNLLMLHCNWNMTVGQGENDLNLTQARAALLSEAFDFIILGHDHHPRRELGGKVVILGNTHPTSFGDLGEKYVWFYHSDTNYFSTEVNAKDSSVQLDALQLIEDHKSDCLAHYGDYEWIDVRGSLPQEAAVDLAKALRALWKACPYLYGLRSSHVTYQGMEMAADVASAGPVNLMEMVESKLTAELKPLWLEAQSEEN